MRIAMIGQKGIPARSGGVERHVEELATRLAASGHEVFVYCRKQYGKEAKNPEAYKGVRLVYVPTIQTKHLDAIVGTFLASIHALFMGIDIFHYHAIGPSLFTWIPRIGRPRAKVIATFHCQDYYHKKWGVFARFVLRLGERAACAFPHETIVVSKTLQKYVQKTYRRESLYIPNGVTIPAKQSTGALAQWGLMPGKYVLSVSRLVKHKGIHYLIDAFRKVKATLPAGMKLVIVGGSSYTDEYVAALHTLANTDPDILFLGEQSGAPLAQLYAHAGLFVQPSEGEGLSVALLEAMSYGIPVLVSSIPQNTEVLPDKTWQFRNKSVPDLGRKIDGAFKKDVGKAGQQNRKHVTENYNFDHLITEALKVYSI